MSAGTAENLILWSDVVLTHLGYTTWTLQVCSIYDKPVVFISHNTSFDAYELLFNFPKAGIIYNSDAMRAQSPFPHQSVVLHPAIDRDKVASAGKRDHITLINCNENKGGKIFSRLAAAMPERQFLAVRGSYDEQFIPDIPNVKVRPNSPDIRSVYEMTRILLMPSRYESWGMTGTEAMASGIPVIACPTFGLRENLGDAGIWVPERGEVGEGFDDGDSYDIRPIIKAIKALDKQPAYQKAVANCIIRAAELSPEKELSDCEGFLLDLASKHYHV